jgi:hypothetical protein
VIWPAGADGVTVCRSTMLQEPAQRRHAALAARVKALAETLAKGTVSRHKVLRCFPDPSDCPSDSLRRSDQAGGRPATQFHWNTGALSKNSAQTTWHRLH